MVKQRLKTYSIGRKKEYCIKRLAVLRPLLDDNRSPNVLRALKQEIRDLESHLAEIEVLIKKEPHSIRPSGLRKGNDWVCNCGSFNVWENIHCWASKPNLDEPIPKSKQENGFLDILKPQSENDEVAKIESFFRFLDSLEKGE